MRRDFVRKIEKTAYFLASEADAETNLRPEHDIDAQWIAELANECIEELTKALDHAIGRGLIERPKRFVASAKGL